MKKIGIVAVSAEGAALCYRTICAEGAALLGPHMHPEIMMHTFPLGAYMEPIYKNDWAAVGELLGRSARKLQDMGAEILLCPDNTIHQAYETAAASVTVPWLHIAQVAGSAARDQGFKHLAVLGTKYLMEGPVYRTALGSLNVQFSIPLPEEREKINDVIFSELVYGKILDSSRKYFQEVINRMKGEACDAVVLGCTEIPLLISPEDSTLPTLDSTRLLARAALRAAVQ